MRIGAEKLDNPADLLDFFRSVTDLATLAIPEDCIVALVEHAVHKAREYPLLLQADVDVKSRCLLDRDVAGAIRNDIGSHHFDAYCVGKMGNGARHEHPT